MALRQSPLFEVLTRTDLAAGVEPRLWVFNLGTGWLLFIMILMVELEWQRTLLASALLVGGQFLFHWFLRSLCRRDALTRRVYIKYQNQADAYDPWPQLKLKRNPRPYGFGRGTPC